MIRSSVVLPEPDGPSSAMSSPARPRGRRRRSAGVAVEVLRRARSIAMSHRHAFSGSSRRAGRSRRSAIRAAVLSDEGDEREERQERGDGEGGDEVVLIVEDLDLQRHGVGQAADVAGDDRRPRRTRPSRGRCRAARRRAAPS